MTVKTSVSMTACRLRLRRLRLPLFRLLLFAAAAFPPLVSEAAENVFTSGAAIKEEAIRLAGEGEAFVKAPVDPHFGATAVVAGVFAVTYVLDEDINSGIAHSHSSLLRGITDVGNTASSPLLHLGVAAAFYGAGAAADQPRVMQVGEEMGEALLLADTATFVLKDAIGRGRPSTGDDNSRYRPFRFKDGYDSLPSMHTASSFAMAHVAASHTDSLTAKIVCYMSAGAAGFSRMYRGKHWGSDVVLGAAVGELAGDTVTRYRALKPGKVAVAPMAVGGVPSLAVIGKFY